MRRRRLSEVPRDLVDSEFTPLLRELWASDTSVLAAVFVDYEGECIDYVASLEPFDAKINGAQMLVVLADVVACMQRLGYGQTRELQLLGDARDVVVRRVSEEYALVAVLIAGGVTRAVLGAIETTVDGIRREAEIPVPEWEAQAEHLDVEVRAAVGWEYAPAAFRWDGRDVVVADVLGRWVDQEEGGKICFRVRTVDGMEKTLAHDPEKDRWSMLS